MVAADGIDGEALDKQRNGAYEEVLFQLHVGRNLVFHHLLDETLGFLLLHFLDQAFQRILLVLQIHSQVDVRGEVAQRVHVVEGAQVDGNGNLDDVLLAAVAVVRVHVLKAVQQCGCEEFGNGAAVLFGNFLETLRVDDDVGAHQAVPAHVGALYMVGDVVFLQVAVAAAEHGHEAVFQFLFLRGVARVEDEAAGRDLSAVFEAAVFGCHGEEEGEAAAAVGEGVEHVHVEAFAVHHHFVEQPAELDEIEYLEAGELMHLWNEVNGLEVPPEGACLEAAAEGGNTPRDILQGTVHYLRVDIFVEDQMQPEEGCIMLCEGSGIYIGGIVQPQFCFWSFHTELSLSSSLSLTKI